MTVCIRRAAIADVERIHILGQCVEEFTTSDVTVTFWPESILRASIDTDTVVILVAEEDTDIVGFIIVNCNRHLSKAIIENIYVHPTRRRQSIGTRLLEVALDEVKNGSYEFICVLTPPDDAPAIKTYQKAGFVQGEQFLWLDFSDSDKFRTSRHAIEPDR